MLLRSSTYLPFQNQIHFHDSLSALHGYLSTDILPEELGGNCGPLETDSCRKACGEFEAYFEQAAEMFERNKAK